MSLVDRVRNNFVFLVLAVLCWAAALSAPAASAETLGGVTGPVTEAVTGTVDEVVEAVPPTVQEASEAVAAPVQEATQVAPPAQEVTEAATAPVEAVKETVTPPVKVVTETVAPTAKAVTETGGRAGSTAGSTARVTEGANQAAQGAVENVLPTAKRATSSPGPDSTSSETGSPRGLADQGSAAVPSADQAGRRGGNSFVPPPAINGSTGAPLPKWLAYIWPAIALSRPGLADSVDRWETAVRLALARSEGVGERSGTGPVVAGARAAGGEAGQADSSPSTSSSPFSKITSAVGDFPYNGAGAALFYILIMAIMAIAIYGAVRWEIARSRRERRG